MDNLFAAVNADGSLAVMDRRRMLSLAGKAAAFGGIVATVPAMEGCSANAWIQTALNDLPIIVQIITNILQIITAAGGNIPPVVLTQVSQWGTEVQTDLKNAQQFVSDYQTAAGSAKPGIIGKIQVALSTAQTDLGFILEAFHVTDTTLQATISAAIGSAITIVLAIETLIPAAPTPAPAAVTATAATQPRPADERAAMKESFNLIVGRHYPASIIP